MKRSLHPAVIAAVVVAMVAVVAIFFVKSSPGDVKGVSMQEAMKTTHGNTVNSFTGEPLTETQKLAAARQEAQFAATQGKADEASKHGTAINFGGRDN